MRFDYALMVASTVLGIVSVITALVCAASDQYDKGAYWIGFAILMWLTSESASRRLGRG